MYIKNIKADGFKNLKDININTHEKINVLYGENAQGKTNLIEAIWLLSGVRSFRSTKEKDFIAIDSDRCEISLDFDNGERVQNVSIAMSKQSIRDKKVKLNGVEQSGASKLFGNLNCVVFTPEDLELSKGSPDNRRSFLDLSISQVKLSYSKVIARYDKLIQQRNALLKTVNLNDGGPNWNLLVVYDKELAKLGAYISMLRYNYIKKLSYVSSKLFYKISHGREDLELFYQSTALRELEGRMDYETNMKEEYLSAIKNSIEADVHSGFTNVGVHRDDLIAKINGLNARDYASQGQHRSIALVLKLSQAYIIAEETGNTPVILLDDILSELDKKRQGFVLSEIEKMQVFITCCEKIPEIYDGRVFEIKDGRII